MDSIEPHTMTLQSAVAFTGLSKATLNRLVARRELTKHHVGKRALFKVADLNALVERSPTTRRRIPPNQP